MEAIAQRLEPIFSDVFWSAELPSRQMTRQNTPAWDSLAHMNLILSIEQEFGVTLSDDEVTDFNSFEVGVQLLSERLASS